MSGRADPRSLTLVGIQMALLAGIALAPPGPTALGGPAADGLGIGLLAAGIGVVLWSAAALGRGLTPMPAPRPGAVLVTRGPYRLVRHPMYVGVVAGALGVAVFRGGVVPLALTGALAVLVVVKARYEESLLRRAYPAYGQYARERGPWAPLGGRRPPR